MKVRELIEWLQGLDNQEAKIAIKTRDQAGATMLDDQTTYFDVLHCGDRGEEESYVIVANS